MPPPKDYHIPNPLAEPSGSDYYTSTVHSDTYPAISPLATNLIGKSVFISGASKGICKAIALSYARAGASQIAIGARSNITSVAAEVEAVAKDAQRSSPKILPLSLDITNQSSVEAAAKEVRSEFGKLDIMVNNAGSLGKMAPIADTDPSEWWDVWTLNIRGTYLVTRSLLPLLLLSSSQPHIINVSSVGAHLATPGLSAYQTSKLALVRFTEFLQAEYGTQGLMAISVHPGNVQTDILAGFGGVPPGLEHVYVETPELVADTVVFLTKEERGWLGGRYVNVTWDMPELMAKEEEIVRGDKLKVRLVW